MGAVKHFGFRKGRGVICQRVRFDLAADP
jgi:hypothetical protein